MKEQYAGYLYEAKGPVHGPISQETQVGPYHVELDCGVSRNVDHVAFVVVELAEFTASLWSEKSITVRGRIESFEGYTVILGPSKLFT
jgi:hypothetical protein